MYRIPFVQYFHSAGVLHSLANFMQMLSGTQDMQAAKHTWGKWIKVSSLFASLLFFLLANIAIVSSFSLIIYFPTSFFKHF